jgi:hypothetical protein
LLLWDELDEFVGYGRHLAAGLSAAVRSPGASRKVARARPGNDALGVAASEFSHHPG